MVIILMVGLMMTNTIHIPQMQAHPNLMMSNIIIHHHYIHHGIICISYDCSIGVEDGGYGLIWHSILLPKGPHGRQ